MAIIHGRYITLCPGPVPRNCSGDGVDGQLGDAMSKSSLVRKPDPGATDPPNGAEGGDAEEVPVTKEGSVGGFLRPMERIVGKEDAWKAGDIKASESVPRVEEPVDDRLNLGAGEEGQAEEDLPYFSQYLPTLLVACLPSSARVFTASWICLPPLLDRKEPSSRFSFRHEGLFSLLPYFFFFFFLGNWSKLQF